MSAHRHWAEHLTLSHRGAAFIAAREGVELRPYHDSEGWVTTGVGHLVLPMHKVITEADIRRWSFPSTRAAVDYFRSHDVLPYVHAVRTALGRSPLYQIQFDMCVSLCFNIGVGAFRRSTVARLIVMGHLRAAADHFLDWDVPPELRGRRLLERVNFQRTHY